MPSTILGGAPKQISLETDSEGHRDYTVVWHVKTAGPSYGPDYAIACTGLPLPGASLNIGASVDPWAFYQRKASAQPLAIDKRRDVYAVTQLFTTRPARRCQTSAIEDPLLEPHKVRGGFEQLMIAVDHDKDGKKLTNSSGERYRGAPVDLAVAVPTIELTMNAAWINLPWLSDYCQAVNNATWWGLAARQLLCDTFTWERVLYGTCYYYFSVNFTFKIAAYPFNSPTWDLRLIDEGTRVKIPGTSPARYRQWKDEREENGTVLLDGSGNKLAETANAAYRTFRCRREKDFSAVGWPATLM